MTQAQTAADEEFCAEQILKARHRIGPFVHCTPVLTSSSLDSLCPGKQLFFKCENFQNTGSFKCRGAMNAVLCALERQPSLTGMVTHSSGNHGQALAWAARQKQLPCVVVVPENTPTVKLDAIRAYGARLVNCEATMAARWATCEQISQELGYTIVDPHNDLDVMAGQGTVAAELMEQVPQLDAIIVSVGGGGLASGIATFAKSTNNNIKVFCAELEGKGLQRQLESGRHEPSEGMAQSVADGIRVIQIGPNCFGPLVRHAEKTVFSLNEEEIRSATLLLWQRLKVVVEPSAALPLAAVLRETTGGSEALKDCGRIGLILCGGNVHIDQQKMFGGGK